MKKPFSILVFSGMLASGFFLTGCDTPGEEKSAVRVMHRYETEAQIKAMPVCRATVEEQYPCYSVFTTAERAKFFIGSPAAPHEVIHFLKTLKQGQPYDFPAVFLEYLAKGR